MTLKDLQRLKVLENEYSAMIFGKPLFDPDGRSWDQVIYNEYVNALIKHAPDLIKAADSLFVDS